MKIIIKLLLSILVLPICIIFGLLLGLVYFPIELAESIIHPDHEVKL